MILADGAQRPSRAGAGVGVVTGARMAGRSGCLYYHVAELQWDAVRTGRCLRRCVALLPWVARMPMLARWWLTAINLRRQGGAGGALIGAVHHGFWLTLTASDNLRGKGGTSLLAGSTA